MPTPTAPTRLQNPALFLCDMQEKFRPAIYEFSKVVSTATKLVKAAKILHIPIYLTTQLQAKIGETVPELADLLPADVKSVDKTAFSMMVPEMRDILAGQTREEKAVDVLLVGIETHICITQTALDLLDMGHHVYVLQDGVSSCNAGERGVALARLAREGCAVTTSESVLYEIMRDAGHEAFKGVSGLVREMKEETRGAVEVFCGGTCGGGGGDGSKL